MSKLTKCIKIRYLSENGWRDVRLVCVGGSPSMNTYEAASDDDKAIAFMQFHSYVKDNSIAWCDYSDQPFEVIEQYGDSFPE